MQAPFALPARSDAPELASVSPGWVVAIREVTVDGRVWTVWDVAPGGMTGHPLTEALRGGWLTLQCGDQKRRIIPSPAGWKEWTDEELADAVRGATPVPHRQG